MNNRECLFAYQEMEDMKKNAEKNKIEIFEKDPENKEIASAITKNDFFEKTITAYKIFSKAYFEREGEFKNISKELIKQRADNIFNDSSDNLGKNIYQKILKTEKPIKNDDFRQYISIVLSERPESMDMFRKAKAESKDKFEEALREFLIELQIESATEIEKPKESYKRIGNLYVEIIGNECRPHIPRIAINWPETLTMISEAFEILAKKIQEDEDFKNIEEISIISWLFSRLEIANDFDQMFGWTPYKKTELKAIADKSPALYEKTLKTGPKDSGKAFKEYLLTGKIPKVEGRKISKEKFIQRMDQLKKGDKNNIFPPA